MQDIHIHAVASCELYSTAFIIMYSGGELWAIDHPPRDLSNVSLQNYDTYRSMGTGWYDRGSTFSMTRFLKDGAP